LISQYEFIPSAQTKETMNKYKQHRDDFIRTLDSIYAVFEGFIRDVGLDASKAVNDKLTQQELEQLNSQISWGFAGHAPHLAILPFVKSVNPNTRWMVLSMPKPSPEEEWGTCGFEFDSIARIRKEVVKSYPKSEKDLNTRVEKKQRFKGKIRPEHFLPYTLKPAENPHYSFQEWGRLYRKCIDDFGDLLEAIDLSNDSNIEKRMQKIRDNAVKAIRSAEDSAEYYEGKHRAFWDWRDKHFNEETDKLNPKSRTVNIAGLGYVLYKQAGFELDQIPEEIRLGGLCYLTLQCRTHIGLAEIAGFEVVARNAKYGERDYTFPTCVEEVFMALVVKEQVFSVLSTWFKDESIAEEMFNILASLGKFPDLIDWAKYRQRHMSRYLAEVLKEYS
jgi:hypothetical protein